MELNQSLKKRASNMVWTAAGRYDFDPLYLFFYSDNEPVLYLNTLEGLAYASMDTELLLPFLKGLDFGRKPDFFRALAQLVLEESIYQKESARRSSLCALREDYARIHLTEFLPAGRYQELGWERQALIHWRKILGLELNGFSKRELTLSEALHYTSALPEKELLKELKSVFRTYFFYQPLPARKSETTKFVGAGLFLVVLGQIFSGNFHIRISDSGEGSSPFLSRLYVAGKHLLSQTTEKEDRDFILRTFGPCLFPPEKMQELTGAFCTGYHTKSRLWYAGATSPDLVFGQEQETQHKKNLAYYQKDKRYYERSIHTITEHLKQVLEEQQEPDLVRVQSGRLDPRLVYRIPAIHDLAVFYREITWPVPDFSVDLVLDASSSRCNEQEAIAAQAYLIATSLLSLQIPVQVTSFRSIRGFTVLQSLKSYDEVSCADGIFHFFTAGNNRDGLAFDAIRALMQEQDRPKLKRIVLILTDAMPSDAQRAYMDHGLFHGKDYRNELAVEDTRNAIRRLRADGICVAAVFWGGDYAISNLHQIYGDSFIRIKQIQQFPDAVSGLLVKLLDQMHEQS